MCHQISDWQAKFSQFSRNLSTCDRIPDGSIPTSVQQLGIMREITGGERVGSNLFYSFEEFSIPTGTGASFKNAVDIENIFVRITGSEAYFIDGLLQTQGGANFLLINPNGIVFGENARLDICGSFVATTADKIEFADGTEFSVRDSKVNLTISVPVGLNLLGDNGSIIVKGKGNQVTNDTNTTPIEFLKKNTNLLVPEGKTFALIGNQINFDKGVISSERSNIYLNSVEKGIVQIKEDVTGLNFLTDKIQKYQDINLLDRALIDSNENISIVGKNISLQKGSIILNNQSGTQQSSGSINIKAAENLIIEGVSGAESINSSIRSETTGETKGADINITASYVEINNQGSIRTITLGYSDSGSININKSSSINISASNMSTYTSGDGEGGVIRFNAKQLKLEKDSSVSTFSGGFGNAGAIEFTTEQITIGESSIISSIAEKSGDAGEININAVHIELNGNNIDERSSIASSSVSGDTENQGNAGSVTINTNVLKVEGGNTISSSSFGTGNAGNVIINASDCIKIQGEQNGLKSIIRSSVDIFTTNEQIRIFLRLPKVPSGNSGNVSINTPNIEIDDLAIVSVQNMGTGNGGKLTINAGNIYLSNQGQITAAAKSGQGGNIELNTKNLQIGEGSQITAEAGNEGNRGNITINTGNLIAKKLLCND